MAAPLLALAALALSAPPAGAQAIQDSRCYLMNGGAVESFFISEDTPVGSIIGTLSVNGDPSAVGGNISLRIQEKNPAVELAAGSKNITLRRALDREEKLGPSSVYVNVRCDRRHTADPSFVIPVSIRVWDVNDNAPAWRGAPYRARVSELAAPGARVLAAPAHDPDQPGPHATVRYAVLPGPASEYVEFQSELDSTVVIKKALDYETLRNFTVRLRAQDGGSPPRYNDTTLSVEVLDADDQNPQFTHEHYTAVIPDNAQDGTVLEISPGPISASDRDLGINAPVYYSASGESAALLRLHRDSGALAATAALLAHPLPVTVVIKATQVDNADRYALATVTVRRAAAAAPGASAAAARGASEASVRFARRGYAVAVPEDAPPGTVLAALHTRSSDETPLQFYVSERSFLEKFAINSAGEVLLRKPLDYEVADHYHYQVMVTDGNTSELLVSIRRKIALKGKLRERHSMDQHNGAERERVGAALPARALRVPAGRAAPRPRPRARGAASGLRRRQGGQCGAASHWTGRQDAVRERAGRGVPALGGSAGAQLLSAARGRHRRGLGLPAETDVSAGVGARVAARVGGAGARAAARGVRVRARASRAAAGGAAGVPVPAQTAARGEGRERERGAGGEGGEGCSGDGRRAVRQRLAAERVGGRQQHPRRLHLQPGPPAHAARRQARQRRRGAPVATFPGARQGVARGAGCRVAGGRGAGGRSPERPPTRRRGPLRSRVAERHHTRPGEASQLGRRHAPGGRGAARAHRGQELRRVRPHEPHRVLLSTLCRRAAVPLCRRAAVPPCRWAAVPLCRRAAVPPCRCAAVPLCRRAAVPPCRCAAVPLCRCAECAVRPAPPSTARHTLTRWRKMELIFMTV